jgi:hypothetical protein
MEGLVFLSGFSDQRVSALISVKRGLSFSKEIRENPPNPRHPRGKALGPIVYTQ